MQTKNLASRDKNFFHFYWGLFPEKSTKKPLPLHRLSRTNHSPDRRCIMQKNIIINNVRFRLVPFHGQDVHPVTGIAFYVNNGRGGVLGVQLFPNGTMRIQNANLVSTCGNGYKQEYLQFKDAWGRHKSIYASHAVYKAWIGPIKPGLTIDHIDGCTTNNDFRNLRAIDGKTNSRDGGFNKKLRNKGICPEKVLRPYLLRYFDRMAEVKNSVSDTKYRYLTRENLFHILYDPDFDLNQL